MQSTTNKVLHMKIAYCIKVLSYPHLDVENCMCKLLTLVRNDVLWCHFHLNTQLPVHFTCKYVRTSSQTNLENSVFTSKSLSEAFLLVSINP